MKAILYIGAVLMTGASVYGFVDYKKSSRNKDFTRLYEEKQEATTAPENKNIRQDSKVVTEKKEVEKPVAPFPPQKTKNPSRALKPVVVTPEIKMTEPEKVPAVLEKPEEPLAPETAVIKENSNANKIATAKTKKRINRKMFSRAALDERYLEKDLKAKKRTKQ